jgi:DNA-binding CsgD family transcriptional regulator
MFVQSATTAEVAALLSEGLSLAETARRTGLAHNTVRYHRNRIADLAREADAAACPEGANAGPDNVDATPPVPTRVKVRGLLDRGCSRIEVARLLGLSKSAVSYHARRLGMTMNASFARRYDWAVIQAYYDADHSLRECQAKFGFSKSAWSDAAKRGAVRSRPRAMPIEDLLSGPRLRSHVKLRLINAGLLPSRCQRCGITDWRGRRLALELHHINGRGRDNRLENLQILCPNCHSQTSSWGGRNGNPQRAR